MLYPSLPHSFVVASITPIHFSEASSQIVLIVSFINVATRPAEDTIPMLLVRNILSFIFIAVSCPFLPHSLSLSQSVLESSLEIASVRPIVLAVAIGLPSLVLPFVEVAIRKLFSSLPMFETLFEVTLVPISVYPSMDAVAVSLAHPPLAHIAVSLGALPHAGPMFEPVDPLALVELAIGPGILAEPFRFSVDVLPKIGALVGELLETQPLLEIALPIALVDAIVLVEHDSLAVTLAVDDLAVVGGLLVLLEFEGGGGAEGGQIEDIGLGLVLLELLDQVFEGGLGVDGPDVGFGDAGLIVFALETSQSDVGFLHSVLYYFRNGEWLD